jgi:hypothetical protein
LPKGFGSGLSPADRISLVKGIEPQQSYNTITAGGKIDFNEGILNEANVRFNRFTDGFGSAENRFYAKPTLRFAVMEESITTNITVDYLGGSFKNNFSNTNTQPLKYGFSNFGISPSFVMIKDDWTLNIGAAVFYSLDTENSKNSFFVYPNITASYKVVGDLMIFYAGAEGNLEQNTYMDFATKNPFVSPTLNITPTDKQFDVYAGLKGKLASNVSYNLRASYLNERNKALFLSNDYNEDSSNKDYVFGNSMRVAYDDVKTLGFSGELKADFSENVSFGIGGSFNDYTSDVELEAWNLPSIKLNSNIDFNITKKWNAGVNVFYVGDRKDQKNNTDIIFITAPSPTTLDSYFDVNANLGFKYSERLSGFLKANNILNNSYQKWMDYPVQGFQIAVGANYKFDF